MVVEHLVAHLGDKLAHAEIRGDTPDFGDERAIDLLDTVMVAPITSTIRGAPSEVPVGVGEGLKHDSVVTLDQVQTVDKGKLHSFVGARASEKMAAVCTALSLAVGCEA